MLQQVPHRLSTFACVALLVGVSAASAQISATAVSLPNRPSQRNAIAFDHFNKVYLIVDSGHPVVGRFLSASGAQIGAAFLIGQAEDIFFTGWAGVAFGGTSGDPTFLVTYVANEGCTTCHTKYGRLVRYQGGQAPLVSGRSPIAAIGGEWPSAEKAQAVWTGQHFVVGTRVPAGGLPQPQVQSFTLSGVVSAAQNLGDFLDYYGSPSVACAPSGVCMVMGYANGIPFGGAGGSYARLFDAQTLAPHTAMFYVDDHSSRMEDQRVVFNTSTQQFLTAWWRAGGVDARTVTTGGALGTLQRPVASDAGDLSLAYNAGTNTSLLVTKLFPADLYAFAVGPDGMPASNSVLISNWDGKWPEYTPSVAANTADGQWLVVASQTNGGRAALITGPGGGGTPGCSFSLPAPTASFRAFGGNEARTLTASAPDCAWTATSNASWLTITSSGSGSGSATVSYHVGRNTARHSRSGSVTIAGQTYTISQHGNIAIHDLNGDGISDLLWHHQTAGYVAAWYLSGSTVVSTHYLSIPVVSDLNWKAMGAGDVNGDGFDDLIWRHAEGYVAVWLLQGNAVLSSQLLSINRVADPAWRIRGVGDTNADGKSDLIWQHDTGSLAIWFMNGPIVTATSSLSIPVMSDPNWVIAGAGDINGDDRADIIWQNHATGGLAAWSLDGPSVINQGSLSIAHNGDLNWKIRGVGDLNGDGYADLIWQNVATGGLAVWYINGYTVFGTSGLSIPSVPDTHWHIVGPG